jgi:hypothetical protein
MDGRAKAFPPSLHRRFSLRMAGLATGAADRSDGPDHGLRVDIHLDTWGRA